MKVIENIESTAIKSISMNEDNTITIVFNNGKSYNYNDISNTFVINVENAIKNNESVGKLFNQALKQDKTLELVTVSQ
jgi:hypothetical protein